MANYINLFYPKPLKQLTNYLDSLVKTRLWLKIIIAMMLGIGVGVVLGPSLGLIDNSVSSILGNWLALPGQIFLGLIQMIVVPLVFASIIRGLASSEDVDQLRKLGFRLLAYFVATTTVAIVIGIIVALLFQPGKFIDSALISSTTQVVSSDLPQQGVKSLELGNMPEVIINLLPQNPLGAMVEKQMLQVVLFSIIFGAALLMMPKEQAKPLLDLLGSLQEVCMTVVRWAMLMAPIAVFGLLAQITLKIGLKALVGMAMYVGTVLVGLIFLLMFYMILIMVIGKKSPWWFLGEVRDVQLLAFSTSSSAAVMPMSIKTAEEKLKVRPAISQFLIPLGATINMDGTALYQGVAAIFLAQVFGIELGIASMLLIIITAVGASIGAPATPGVGIVILAMVLESIGVPASGIALIIGVDRILDMSRTAINVTGDLTACIIMDRWID